MKIIPIREGRAKLVAREWGTKAAIAAQLSGEDRRAYIEDAVQYFVAAEREAQAARERGEAE